MSSSSPAPDSPEPASIAPASPAQVSVAPATPAPASAAPARLRQFARFYGLQPDFIDGDKRVQAASQAGLIATLKAWGVPLAEDLANLDELLAARRLELWRQIAPPTAVAWEGQENHLELRLPTCVAAPFDYRLELEGGTHVEGHFDPAACPARRTKTLGDETFCVRRFPLPKLPLGYHKIVWTGLPGTPETRLISAPLRCGTAPKTADRRVWGLFLPLYALHAETDLGTGDFRDLEAFAGWTAEQGGSIVANLPLLATFCATTDDPSPYSSASRLFANELFLDLQACPELATSPAARAKLAELTASGLPEKWRAEPRIDYAAILAKRTEILDLLADAFFTAQGEASPEFKAFAVRRPDAVEYACFRALGEQHTLNWRVWPEGRNTGFAAVGDGDRTAYRRHLYAQFRVDEQMNRAPAGAAAGMIRYLDLPLGVSSDSYDVWKNQGLFVLTASGGAPPDGFFTKGQDWGFPPLHPQVSRTTGHGYFVQVVRRHLEQAKLLRIDHVMGLYRFYWVPHGLAASDGVYVRYPAADWFAVLTLESTRSNAGVCGENLGTVPARVEELLERHGVLGTYCLQFSAGDPLDPTLRAPTPNEVACLNTHDMPTFAGFWQGLDLDDRVDLGLLTDEERQRERESRALLRRKLANVFRQAGCLPEVPDADAEPTPDQALLAALRFLARSDAAVMLVNLEDLWLETQPQNTPGTWKERPNWRMRAKHSLEAIRNLPGPAAILAEVAHGRASGNGSAETG